MDHAAQSAEVDRNFDAFQRRLVEYLRDHRGEYALMRAAEVVGFFTSVGGAYRAGLDRFADRLFSIQEVTDEPIDLGFFSHVGH